MTINVGINGMGRIGRMVIRAIIESQNKNIKIKHINNRSNSEASCTLIKYDSVHGKFNVDLDYDENHLIINKNKITFSQESKIENINWKKYVGIDGLTFGINTFGKSAPYTEIYKHFGLTSANIASKSKRLFGKKI